MTLEELKAAILQTDPETLADEMVLAGDCKAFGTKHVDRVRTRIAEAYGVAHDDIDIRVVGSAKLGFALFQKKLKSGAVLPRFRQFGPNSDIDLAIISPKIFEILWDEISAYAIHRTYFPWDSARLGDYLVHGWLRPDLFPNARLERCDKWWGVFRTLSADPRFGRKRISGAPFHNFEHLRRYIARGLRECRKTLELQE